MHRLPLTAALCLALGACATAPSQKLSICDGRHRRPANPNGSVLAEAARPATPTASASTRAGSASYAPCGGRS